MKQKLLCPSCGHHIGNLESIPTPGQYRAAAGEPSVREFIREKCRLDPEAKIRATEFFDTYTTWCAQGQIRAVPSRTVGRLVSAIENVELYRSNGKRYYRGISLI